MIHIKSRVRVLSALILQMAFTFLTVSTSHAEVEETITNLKGNSVEVIVLAVNDSEVRVRRPSDGLESVIKLMHLSKESQEKLKKLQAEVGSNVRKKPSAELPVTDEMLEKMREHWVKTKANIPDAGNPKIRLACSHLISLMNVENDLIALASPKKLPSPEKWPREVDSRLKRKVEEIKHGVRDGHKIRVLKMLGYDPSKIMGRSTQTHTAKELTKLFRSTSAPLREKIEERYEEIVKGKKRDTFAESITELEDSIGAIHLAFYGYKPGEWVEYEPEWPAEHPAETLRKEMYAFRKSVHERLVHKVNHAGEAEVKTAEISGLTVYSSNIGIVLDTSGSMLEFIEPLKNEIGSSFENPVYREIPGCSLRIFTPPEDNKAVFWDTIGVLPFFEEMLLVYQVDTLYWFSDLNDEREDAALLRLGELLRMTGAKLYVRSVGRGPTGKLKDLVEK